MAYGCQAVADPQDFALSCQLDNSEPQEGQEFMKLLLEKLDEAFRASSDTQVCSAPIMIRVVGVFNHLNASHHCFAAGAVYCPCTVQWALRV